MLESILSGTAGETLSLAMAALIILSALIMGLVISLVYLATHRKEAYTPSFIVALVMLPAIIAMIIYLVGNNVARAFSLAGAFSLIRFRSAPGNSKDIAYVFFTLGVGLACGMGYIAYGALFAAIMCLAMLALTKLKLGGRSRREMLLRIAVPEHMDYDGVFDSALTTYAEGHRLVKVKTTEYGAMFDLTYEVTLADLSASKELIDTLRCLNGNMNVSLSANQPTESPVF